MNDELSLRESKKAETRATIHRAAIELFATQGYQATTISMIARKARIGNRTFFTYYGSKKDVLFSIPESYCNQLIGLLTTKDGTQTTVHTFKTFLASIVSSPPPDYFVESDLQLYSIAFRTPELQDYALAMKQRVADALAYGFAQDMHCALDDFPATLAGNLLIDSLWMASGTLFPYVEKFSGESLDNYFGLLDQTLAELTNQLTIASTN